jgi:hypothetical protein
MTLHCVRQADDGGRNDLLDHELAYIACAMPTRNIFAR